MSKSKAASLTPEQHMPVGTKAVKSVPETKSADDVKAYTVQTVKLGLELHKRIRMHGFNTRQSSQAMFIAAITQYLNKHEA